MNGRWIWPGIDEFGGEEEGAREETTRITCTYVSPDNIRRAFSATS